MSFQEDARLGGFGVLPYRSVQHHKYTAAIAGFDGIYERLHILIKKRLYQFGMLLQPVGRDTVIGKETVTPCRQILGNADTVQ